MKKFLLALVSLALVFAAVSCDKKVKEEVGKVEVAAIDDEAEYDKVLGDFYTSYAESKKATTVTERFALMAVAEAKLLESGIMLPLSTSGGNYAIGAIAPYTGPYSKWGNDEYRYHNYVVADKALTNTDRDALKALWKDLKGTGTYEEECKKYLVEKGYTLQDTYDLTYSSDPETYDAFFSSNASDSEVLVNTFDGLIEYNCEGELVGALATKWEVSEDGLQYTFYLRDDATWVDRNGNKIDNVKADDFEAGFNHMLDDPNYGLEWLVEGLVEGVAEYIAGECGFDEVGVKADDENNTITYTLTAPTSYFITMFGYSVFAPLCRSYFVSKGGAFGADWAAAADTCTYGKDADNIAYCGPYIIKSAIAENSFVFEKNPSYYNADKINIKTITWHYVSGSTATESYDMYKAGTIDACGLNTAAKAAADTDGLQDYIYVTGTGTSTYPFWLNVYRRGYKNCNDATALVTGMTQSEADKTNAAMQIQKFRLAVCQSIDRGAYMAASVGEELKYNSMMNSYVPGTYVNLPEDYTLAYTGKTYKAGTMFGQIVQDVIDKDGYKITVFDPTLDGGVGNSTGFDGWYNVEVAKQYYTDAIAELTAAGYTVTKENPIKLEYPYQNSNAVTVAAVNAVKKSIEEASDGLVVVLLNGTDVRKDWLYAAYYFSSGADANYNISYLSGWGPDYGDPSTYLDTMIKGGGYMVKCIGLDA